MSKDKHGVPLQNAPKQTTTNNLKDYISFVSEICSLVMPIIVVLLSGLMAVGLFYKLVFG